MSERRGEEKVFSLSQGAAKGGDGSNGLPMPGGGEISTTALQVGLMESGDLAVLLYFCRDSAMTAICERHEANIAAHVVRDSVMW